MHQIANTVLTKIGISIILGFPAAFLLKRLYDIFIVPFRRKKLLQKAFKKNRCVKAYLVDYHDDRFGDTDHHTVRIHAFYNYTVDGRTYSYRRWYNNSPEYEITLYYQHNPRKAFEADHFGRLEGFGKMVLLYMISVAIILIIQFFITEQPVAEWTRLETGENGAITHPIYLYMTKKDNSYYLYFFN